MKSPLNPKIIFFLLAAFVSSGICCFGQLHNYSNFNSSKPSIESNNFIIWSGDTLNRRDEDNLKTGIWIEYKKEYIIDDRSSSLLTGINSSEDIIEKVDTLNVQYRIKAIGTYEKGKRSGEWTVFYKNRNLKATLNFIQGKAEGEAKIFYNKWPTTVKFEGKISNGHSNTDFRYYDSSENFIRVERFNIYKLLEAIE